MTIYQNAHTVSVTVPTYFATVAKIFKQNPSIPGSWATTERSIEVIKDAARNRVDKGVLRGTH